MPSASTITLTDSAAVDSDFAPTRFNGNKALFVNKDAITSAGRRNFSITLDPASAKRSSDHVKVRFASPAENTVDGLTSVVHTPWFSCEFILPVSMTLTERKNLLAESLDLLGDAILKSYVEDLEPAY